MYRTSFAEMNCSIARSLEVVGEWWTLLILRDAFGGVRRFEDLQRDLGIARTVLAERLQRLVDHRVLERHRYCEHPPRYEYHLTEKGRDLYPVIMALMRWGDRWTTDADGPPVVVRHSVCGGQGHPVLTCRHCGEEVRPREVEMMAGPGANGTASPQAAAGPAEVAASFEGTGLGPGRNGA
ncbi:MAG TPA: helix-turn-helix domain-containing protein [Acidimicrobiales bacterium]|nr:helix-turn-helix domain-containing protein [Acidimicrobiales bacterium]